MLHVQFANDVTRRDVHVARAFEPCMSLLGLDVIAETEHVIGSRG